MLHYWLVVEVLGQTIKPWEGDMTEQRDIRYQIYPSPCFVVANNDTCSKIKDVLQRYPRVPESGDAGTFHCLYD